MLFCGRLMAVLGGLIAYGAVWALRDQYTALDWLVPGILAGASLGVVVGLLMTPKD